MQLVCCQNFVGEGTVKDSQLSLSEEGSRGIGAYLFGHFFWEEGLHPLPSHVYICLPQWPQSHIVGIGTVLLSVGRNGVRLVMR